MNWGARLLVLGPLAFAAVIFALGPMAETLPPDVALWLAVVCCGAVVLGCLPGYGALFGLLPGVIAWVPIAVVPALFLPIWVSGPVFVLILMIPVLTVMRLGRDMGAARAARLVAAGRGIREWEWVYVGRAAARAHPAFALSPGILLTCVALLAIVAAWSFMGPVFWPLVALEAVTLLALLRKWPVAYPLTFVALAPALPLTAPVMVYWADGVRPNLVYRHRFERLVPQEEPA